MGNWRRSATPIRASPACGPAPVTIVPETSTPARRTADRTVSHRSGVGMTRRGAAASSSPIRTKRIAATQARTIDGSRWSATVHQASPASTVIPPITACATIPSGIIQARTSSCFRRPARWSARINATATATSTNVRSRFPNSTAWCSAGAAPGTGTKLSWLHRGQLSQPSPDAVTRTVTPVVMMPIWAMTFASAIPFWARNDGIGSLDSGPPSAFGVVSAGVPEDVARDVEVTCPILGRGSRRSAIR